MLPALWQNISPVQPSGQRQRKSQDEVQKEEGATLLTWNSKGNKNKSSCTTWKEGVHPFHTLHETAVAQLSGPPQRQTQQSLGHMGTLFPQGLVHHYLRKNKIKLNTKSKTLWRQAGFFWLHQMASSWWKTQLGNGEFSFRVESFTNLWHVYQWSVFMCMRHECVRGFI